MTEPEGQRLGKAEFIALMAMMFATIAFSIDAMLPALPAIANDIAPEGGVAQAALVMTFFVIGMGAGTFFTGPLSDAIGRKPVVYLGLAIYALGAVLSWVAPTLELMLAARVLQGLGAAGPRVVSAAIIRDLYAGRAMASILSLTMMVFLLVPAIAPLLGKIIMDAAGWRAIFPAFLIFALILLLWFGTRVSETLPRENRRPLRWPLMIDAVGQMFANRTVRLSIYVQTLMLMILFSVLTMVQPIFEVSFDRADTFPLWFGAIALASGVSSLLNAAIVGRFGMRRMVTWALTAQVVVSTVFVMWMIADMPGLFWFYIFWQWGVMFQGGLTVANLNAIAMEPMGHIAGMAASVIGAVSTVLGAAFASPVGLMFDGTPMPLIATVLMACIVASILMQQMRRAEEAVA
ncbi:multidrug effflux MFS transporter [Tateyamaria sp. ANG-S1]|uniref:multidrug effflux MFS transporter n=1 Tax=Tateyamaria sp. ANG-S1 TaxID=1577905 RepID=UPI00057C64B3|nr:multidrug effflux MFS transporter [Tateyamaria sp. ANG-S1]KIC48719.1 multidrug MFS transporter [Tateyamaria sp. ANG-S1]